MRTTARLSSPQLKLGASRRFFGELRDTIHVNVEYFDGQEDGDVGYPYYVASCEEMTAVTDGTTLDDLLANIREMIELILEDQVAIKEFNLAPNPRIVIKMELPTYAQIA